MKNILTAFCLGIAMLLASCSDTDNINTGMATVGFGEAQVSVKERVGFFHVPVVVAGEQNGTIELDVKVIADDPNCVEDKNYLVTSKHLIVPSSKTSVNVEIKVVDDRMPNDDRKFKLQIENVKGGTVSSTMSTTQITILDNDNVPYELMYGVWTVTADQIDPATMTVTPVSWELNMNVLEEGETEYGKVVNSSPWGQLLDAEDNLINLSQALTFDHNALTKKSTLTMKIGSTLASGINLGVYKDPDTKQETDLTKAYIRTAIPGAQGLVYSGSVVGEVSADYSEIVFPNTIYMILFDSAKNPFMYYGIYDNLKLTFSHL